MGKVCGSFIFYTMQESFIRKVKNGLGICLLDMAWVMGLLLQEQ